MDGADSAAIYDQARAHVEELQRQLGEGFGDQVIAGLTRAERSAANKANHHRSQFVNAATRPPTLRQKQLLWALGYRGPGPANRAEVVALVERLRAENDRRALAAIGKKLAG
jgi:hypothetical protein